MDIYKEFCIRFWESTRHLDLYSMDGTQLDRLIVDALSKTNGGGELIKTSMNELSVLINAFNHNNRKIQPPSLPSNLDEAAKEILCALVGNKDYLKVIGRIEPETMLAIRFADELIKQLKEEEGK